jgi:hypothetical protein
MAAPCRPTLINERARLYLYAIGLPLGALLVSCKPEAPAPPPTPVPTVVPSPTPDTKRLEAIAALKAVDSVVANQGTLEQFRKYQLEAAIKVDALPDAPSNRDIKAAAILYKHANILAGISQQSTVFSSQLKELKETYADLPEFVQTLKRMDTRLAEKEVQMIGMTGVSRELLAVEIQHGRAQNHLLALKAMGLLATKASPLVRALQ